MRIEKIFEHLKLFLLLNSDEHLTVTELLKHVKGFSNSSIYAILQEWTNNGFVLKHNVAQKSPGSPRTEYKLSSDGKQYLKAFHDKWQDKMKK